MDTFFFFFLHLPNWTILLWLNYYNYCENTAITWKLQKTLRFKIGQAQYKDILSFPGGHSEPPENLPAQHPAASSHVWTF